MGRRIKVGVVASGSGGGIMPSRIPIAIGATSLSYATWTRIARVSLGNATSVIGSRTWRISPPVEPIRTSEITKLTGLPCTMP